MIKKSAIVLIKIFTEYHLLKAVSHFYYRDKRLLSTRLYVKENLHLTEERLRSIRIFTQFLTGTLCISLVAFIFLNNLSIFGVTVNYSLSNRDKNISDLGPSDRFIKIQMGNSSEYKIVGDLIYFSTNVPFKFDTATVTVTYKNPTDKDFYLGFRDKPEWHYDLALLDSPLLNSLTWTRSEGNVSLFQREKKYTSAVDFLKNPPKDGVIGTYNYDIATVPSFQTVLADYKPDTKETVVTTPLRGRQVIYAYLKNEPFSLTVTKQDLNWYEGEDTVDIKIYKDGEMVYSSSIPDDGIQDSSRRSTSPQTVEIRNPGPGLPEPGVYKIVFNMSGDTIIKKMETNLHKIVFEGPIFPANNSVIYPGTSTSTTPTTLYSDAMLITAETYHTLATQTISVGNKFISISQPNVPAEVTTDNNLTPVTIPKNDLILNGLLGYFSMTEDQFFRPSPYYVIPVKTEDDLNLVDYILADYKIPEHMREWTKATRTFNLSTAEIDDKGRLSWLLNIPGLSKEKGQFLIKNINITYVKKPLSLNNIKLKV